MTANKSSAQDVKVASMKILVEGYKIPFTPEYLSWKLGWSHEFSAGILREYKRFVILALTSDEEITPSRAIDEVWHYHILHTREYERFASLVGTFLHHHPGGASTEENSRYSGQYERTKVLYQQTFHEPPPAHYWPGEGRPSLRNVLGRVLSHESTTRAVS